jgi:hypothetical protein
MADFKSILDSILVNKKPILDRSNAKVFDWKLANGIMRTLSFHYDCIHFVNEINQYRYLDPLMKYHFLLNTIRGGRRKFVPMTKVPQSDEVEAISEYFNCSLVKAREYKRMLSATQIQEIQKHVHKGGFSNGHSKRNGRGATKAT